MERLRFYFDEHIYDAVAHGLRLHGVDVLTAHEAGRRALPDSGQLRFCHD